MAPPLDELVAAYRRGYVMLVEALVRARPTVFSEVRDILSGLFALTRRWIQTYIPEEYTKGRERAINSPVTDTDSASEGLRQNIPEGKHRAAIEDLAYDLYEDLQDSLSLVRTRVQQLLASPGDREARLSERETRTNIGGEIQESLEESGIAGLVDRAGRVWRPDTYAEMAAATKLAEARNEGMLNELEDRGHDLVEITETSAPCGICAMYEGRVYSISGRDDRFPPLRGTAFSVAHSTIHPRCKHDLMPWIEEFSRDPRATIQKSNRPFEDERSEAQKRRYDEGQKRKRQARQDRRRREEEAALGATTDASGT